MTTNSEMATAIEDRLRLDGAAVAVKLVPAGEEPPDGLIERTKVLSFCQFVTAASGGRYPLWVTRENLGCPNARIAFGLWDQEKDVGLLEKAVKTHVGVYAPDAGAARRLIAAKPAIPPGQIEGLAVAPLSRAFFEPDAVMLVVTPWQAYFALGDYMYATGEAPLEFQIGTNSLVCAFCAVRAAYLDRIGLTYACTGGRNYAGIERTQLTLAFPASTLPALLAGIEQRSRRVPYPGMIAMPAPVPIPPKHILMPEGDA